MNPVPNAPPTGPNYDKVDFTPPTWRDSLREFLAEWGTRLAVWLTVLVIVGYCFAVTVAYYAVPSIADSQLKWVEVALAPLRWAEFRQKQGEGLNAAGLRHMARAEYNEAFFKLRAGVARAPEDAAARIALAELFASFDLQKAVDELEDGLSQQPTELKLHRALIALLMRYDCAERLLAFGPTAMPWADDHPAKAAVLIACATKLIDLERHADALKVLRAVPATARRNDEYLLPFVRTLIGLHDLAGAHQAITDAATSLTPLQKALLECELASAAADDEALQSGLRQLAGVDPDPAHALIVAYYSWHHRRRDSLREQAGNELLTFHGHEAETMRRFGGLLVTLDRPEVLTQSISYLETQGRDPFVLQVLATELALKQGRFDAAFRQLQLWEARLARAKGAERSYPEFIRRLTRGLASENAALTGYLQGLPTQVAYPRYLLALQIQKAHGRLEAGEAGQLAEQALRIFPLSDELGKLGTEIGRVLAERKRQDAQQQQQAREQAEKRYGDRAVTLAELDALLQQGNYPEMRAVFRELRTFRPNWYAESEATVGLREAKLCVLADEPQVARDVVRQFFLKFRDEGTCLELLSWAKEMESTGRRDSANMIRQEAAMSGNRSAALSAALAATPWEDDMGQQLRTPEKAFPAMDQALGRGDPDYVVRAITLLRRAAPPWLEQEARQIALRDMLARVQLGERMAAAVLLRDVVRTGPEGRTLAVSAITDLARGGRYDDALMLAKELVRLYPGDRTFESLWQRLDMKAPL